jgi:hypothetical protein
MPKDSYSTISSLQNIRGNTIFAQSVMKETEILFIQEHWLFKFEEKEFKTLIDGIVAGLSVVLLVYPL